MAKAKVYRVRISIDNETLNIRAHKFVIENNQFVAGDTIGRRFTRKLDKRNREVLAYVLDSEEWDTIRTYWDGYYAWEDSTFLQVGDTPEEIQKWLDGLPEYQISIGGN